MRTEQGQVGGPARTGRPARTRDPHRRRLILDAAAELLAQRGFHAVSLDDIGAQAGVTGPAIYRHFAGKGAILVALFDEAVDELLVQEEEILRTTEDLSAALAALVAGQVDFVAGRRELAEVYYTEIRSLPERDRVRLRRKQRQYVEGWVHVLSELRPELDEASVRALVHAAIGAIQSALFHHGGLPAARLRLVLAGAAGAVLGLSMT